MQAQNSLVSRLVGKTAVWLVINAALLFIPAGSLHWPEAWVFLAEVGIIGLASGLIIARHDPALLEERMKPMLQKEQKGWDKALLPVFFVLWLGQYVVAGLDAVRFEWSHVPFWLKVVGGLGVAFGFYIFHVVMRANTFAAPVVKIQSERKHRVVSTGPYAYVRHPMYGGAIFLALGTPLLLGSWYGVAIGVVTVAVLALRAVLEEEMLKRELDGYEAYAARVRYRLVPGVW